MSAVILCEIKKDVVREDRVLELHVACFRITSQVHVSEDSEEERLLGIGGVFCLSCKCGERSLGVE